MNQLADSHIHLFRHGFAGRYGRSPAGGGDEVAVYESLRRAHDIAAALVVGYEDDGIDPSNNAYLRELAATRTWMATLAYVRAGEPGAAGRVPVLLAAGHLGIALYLLDPAASTWLAAWDHGAWAALARCRAIVSVNVVAACLPAVEAIARDHPACTFLIAHLGDPGSHAVVPSRAAAAERLAPLLRLAELPNVAVKISGLYAVGDPPHRYPHEQATPFVELVIERFGARRCLWGSDFSPSLDAVSFEQTVDLVQLAGLAADDRQRIMGGNLIELLAAVC